MLVGLYKVVKNKKLGFKKSAKEVNPLDIQNAKESNNIREFVRLLFSI